MRHWKDGQLQGGAPSAHGSTHSFGSTDAIPGGEQIEQTWVCTATESVGDAVYQSASGNVRQARADTVATMGCLGFIKSKPTTTSCIIVKTGELGGFAGLTPDALYFVSAIAAGAISTSHPTTPNLAQLVGRAVDTTTLNITIGQPVQM